MTYVANKLEKDSHLNYPTLMGEILLAIMQEECMWHAFTYKVNAT